MRVFVGCYTKKISDELNGKGKGIYFFEFDSTKGQLKLVEIVPALNPSYLIVSKDKKYLFALEEIAKEESPKIKSFKIKSDGNNSSLTLISEQNLPGAYACHLNLTNSQTHLIVACYMSGNALVYPLGDKGRILPFTQNIQHKGKGPNLIRQEAAHTHMIYSFGSNGIFIVDLSLDLAKAYILESSSRQFIESPELDISISKGAGARHMTLHPNGNFAFVFSELTAELFSYKLFDNKFKPLEVLPTLPNDFDNIPSGAAIRMHPNGNFLYVSNRGADSITIFQFDIESEKLLFLCCEPSGGKTPREINIDPTGQWLLVANQDSDNIVVFSINQKTGLLRNHSVNNELNSPSCIQFIEDIILPNIQHQAKIHPL
jgi:6-phosphogluconolactonase